MQRTRKTRFFAKIFRAYFENGHKKVCPSGKIFTLSIPEKNKRKNMHCKNYIDTYYNKTINAALFFSGIFYY